MRSTVLLAAAALALTSGCATLIHGTTQDVGFASSPSQATLKVNGVSLGTTPLIAKLGRKQSHIVRLELDGYQPYETTLTKSVSGWVWGNLVFGGVIGLAVDASTGGLYKLNPQQVDAQLAQGSAGTALPGTGQASAAGRDAIHVRVVLHPDPAWTKVGQLVKE